MKIWMLILIAFLELLSNASRASERENLLKEEKTLKERVLSSSVPQDEVYTDHQANRTKDYGLVKNIRQDLLNDKSLSRSSK